MLLKILESERAHNLFKKATGMCKYTKVYMRNKKESNISLPLRFNLLRSIFVQNMSVKDAATKWRVHYSSAKIIARTARRNKLYIMFDKEFSNAKPGVQCTYRVVDPEQKSTLKQEDVKINVEQRESDHYNGQSLTYFSYAPRSKIQIHSSIGWTYLGQEGLKI